MFIISEEEHEARQRMSAHADKAVLEALLVLAKNNDFAATIRIAGLKAGLSLNSRLLPVIEAEIAEIDAYLKGEPNNYE